MTAKRFQIDFDEEAITDNGEYCISLYCFQDKGERVVCDLLNQLNEENEELKQNCKNYQWYKEYKRLLNENEQLKYSIKCLEADKMELQQYIKRMQGDVE